MSEVSPRVEEILYSAGKTSGCSGGRFVRIEDADPASPAPEMLKTVVHGNQNYAGIYGAVIRTGQVVTDRLFSFLPQPESGTQVIYFALGCVWS